MASLTALAPCRSTIRSADGRPGPGRQSFQGLLPDCDVRTKMDVLLLLLDDVAVEKYSSH